MNEVLHSAQSLQNHLLTQYGDIHAPQDLSSELCLSFTFKTKAWAR